MYKIGEFSKIVDLPVRTLRYYDEIGVLKPGYVDDFTNYRYYTIDNVNDAYMIKLLRNNGFTLEEILLYKDALTSEIIDTKISELENELENINSKIRRLNIIKEELNQNSLIKDNVIVLKKTMKSEENTLKNIA